jgi:ribosome-binding protein aMBF1 (putative translation factor)
MKNENIKKILELVSEKDSGWLEKAKWRQENEDWLDISFSIAVKVASTLSANKKENIYPKSQVELAEAMGCSAQYVNKLMRGQEKLQIDTICKVQCILGIKLIEVPD